MVRINDILGISLLVIIAGSTLLSKNRGSYQLQNQQITPRQFYKPQIDFNLKNIATIENAKQRLESIRTKTLSFEKQKTEQQKSLLQATKSEYGSLISSLENLVREGQKASGFSPRVRKIVISKRGYDPVDPLDIERGKKAGNLIKEFQNVINKIDQNILKLNKSYSSLESI